jgi:hypothetical protein
MIPCGFGRRVPGRMVLCLAVLGLAGCGGGSRVPVTGSVSFNGEPVDNGSISFIAADAAAGGEAVNAGGDIKDGKYSIAADRGPKPGKYKVEIYWNKKTGRTVPTPGDAAVPMPETKQTLPPKFNKQSQLTADITSGRNTVNFDLKP